MIPVFQRIIDKGRGDCLTACFASLLELPIEEVPAFNAIAIDSGAPYPGYTSYEHEREWLRLRNLHAVRIAWEVLGDWRSFGGAYCIASLPSQRFEDTFHAVVAQFVATGARTMKFTIVHDPNPMNKPYPDSVAPKWITFLVPIDPSKPCR